MISWNFIAWSLTANKLEILIHYRVGNFFVGIWGIRGFLWEFWKLVILESILRDILKEYDCLRDFLLICIGNPNSCILQTIPKGELGLATLIHHILKIIPKSEHSEQLAPSYNATFTILQYKYENIKSKKRILSETTCTNI
jgi:hypothetical protein